MEKINFFTDTTEYLGNLLTQEGINSLPKKVQKILSLQNFTNIEWLHMFLGMVEYYYFMIFGKKWIACTSNDFVVKCGQTKTTYKNNN